MRLGDICTIKYGKDHKKLNDGDIPLYGSGGVMRHVEKALWSKPSVLIPRKGTLGNLFFVNKPFWTVDTCFWTDIDEEQVLPEYLFYQLKTKDLASLNVGTAVPSLTTDVLNEVQIDLPSLEKQKQVVEMLGSLDSKIEINTQLNGYLEKLVSLEFSRRFKASTPTIELGKVLSISTESIKPQEHAGEIWEHYSIPAYDENRQPLFELSDGIKSNKYAIDANCILISKLNPATKRIWMPSCTSEHSVCSTEFIVYKPKNPRYKSFYYAAIDSQAFTDFLIAHVTGSTGSRQRTQPKATLTYPMPNPGHDAIEGFCAFANPIYKQIQSNKLESKWLVSLRDALLPKLMSGEIDVSKIDLTQLNSHLA